MGTVFFCSNVQFFPVVFGRFPYFNTLIHGCLLHGLSGYLPFTTWEVFRVSPSGPGLQVERPKYIEQFGLGIRTNLE